MNRLRAIFRKRFLSPLLEFIHDSRAVGITLIICTAISLLLSNTGAGPSFTGFWEQEMALPLSWLHLPHSPQHWINDGLMTLFFLLAGMEIKRELLEGELSSRQKASLPVITAIGGMVCPALLYFSCTLGSDAAQGWGVPMATDIAFSLGVLSLVGSRAPLSLKILLTALAIIDDLGAIIAIALFYTDHISWPYLAGAGALLLLLIVMNKTGVKRLIPYFIIGLGLWYCLFNSGVHATLAGVLLAFALPRQRIPALEHRLHDPVSFGVLPLFALANTAIVFPEDMMAALSSPESYGILAGLVLGKPLGITLAGFIAVRLKIAALPAGLNLKHLLGMGMLAGIGFTMSIFIAMLAFREAETLVTAKTAVLAASVLSGLAGYLFLVVQNKRTPTPQQTL